MSVLRIYCSLLEPPRRCAWAWIEERREVIRGEGPLADLPRRATRVQLVIPGAQVVFMRAHLPQTARRRAGSVLAFAVEEEILGEPDDNQVSWLGAVEDADVLAVWNRLGLKRWLDALNRIGIRTYEVHCETLLLPCAPGEWSLAWNGSEGFVRTGALEGAATDCGDWDSPPLSLRLMLDEAAARDSAPDSIAIYTTAPDAISDMDKWQRELGITMHDAGRWSWETAPVDAGVRLMQERRRWGFSPETLARLRPAAWIAAGALAIHALALVTDWTLLTVEQRRLRQQMESRFRTTFPDAVAVADPALQMRRKVAEARHAVGQPDDGDFLPMIETAASGMKELPAGSLRVVSYEYGRLTLELAPADQTKLGGMAARLVQAGLRIDAAPTSPRAGGKVLMIVRSP